MEFFVGLLLLAAVTWFLAGPIMLILHTTKLNALEETVRRLTRELDRLKSTPSPSPEKNVLASTAESARSANREVILAAIHRAAAESGPETAGTIASVSKISPLDSPSSVASNPTAQEVIEDLEGLEESSTSTLAAIVSEPPAPAKAAPQTGGFDELVASQWLSWVGAVAVMIGVGFALKYAIEEQMLNPAARVVLGMLGGVTAFALGVFAMRKDYRVLAEGLAGAAMGTLYFSLFAAFRWYELLPQSVAFTGMVLVTAVGLSFAGIFYSLPSAVLAMIGGFLTPYMLSKGDGDISTLFTYILILDLGVLALATFRNWGQLHLVNFGGTVLIWLGWLANGYHPDELWLTVGWISVFGVLFSLLGVWRHVLRGEESSRSDTTLMQLTPLAYFGALYGLTRPLHSDYHGLMALLVAAYYLGLGAFAYLRNRGNNQVVVSLVGIGLSFVTLAVPLQWTGHWITIAWALESLLLIEIGLRYSKPGFRVTGFALLAVVQLHMMLYGLGTLARPEEFDTRFVREMLGPSNLVVEAPKSAFYGLINGRSLSFLANAVVLAILAWEYRRREKELVRQPSTETLRQLGILQGLPDGHQVTAWLMPAVPIVVLSMGLLETFVYGVHAHWSGPAHLSVLPIWFAIFSFGVLLAFRGLTDVPSLGRLAQGLYTITGGLLLVSLLALWFDSRFPVDGPWGMVLFSPRGFGFLTALGAAAAGASLFSTRREAETAGWTFGDALTVAVPLVVLGLCLTEVYAFGQRHDWTWAAHWSAVGIGLALVTMGVRWWGERGETSPHPLLKLSQLFYAGLAGVVLVLFFGTLSDESAHGRHALEDAWRLPLLNPRGISLGTITIAGVLGWRWTARDRDAPLWLPSHRGVSLGLFAYIVMFLLLTIEVFAQGKQHSWKTTTSLAITGVWSLMAMGTIGAGLICRSAPIRVVALAVLTITTAKVFLYDVWYLDKPIRAAAFFGLGLALFATTFLYRRFQGQLKDWIQPTSRTNGD